MLTLGKVIRFGIRAPRPNDFFHPTCPDHRLNQRLFSVVQPTFLKIASGISACELAGSPSSPVPAPG